MEEFNRDVLLKYLLGETSETQNQEINEWLQASTSNRQLLSELQKVWYATGELSDVYMRIELEKELDVFLKEIERRTTESGYSFGTTSEEESPRQRRRFFFSVVRYAAAVLLLAAVAIGAYYYQKHAEVSYTEVAVKPGSRSQITLADGTVAWLNSGSRLRYAENYNVETREVILEGEGYFDVARDEKRPFIVKTSSFSVQALGTEFNVKYYPDDNVFEATLVEGVVKINEAKGKDKEYEAVLLKPVQQMSCDLHTGNWKVKDVDAETYTGWRENKLILTGESFATMKSAIERWYGVTIDVKAPEVLQYHFKGTFEQETLAQMLETLRLASDDFTYTIDKTNVVITK